MFGFGPKLPVTPEERQWIDSSFDRLCGLLGAKRMTEGDTVLPIREHFPHQYDKTEASLNPLFTLLCEYMEIERDSIDLQVFPDEEEHLRRILPAFKNSGTSCAGFFTRTEDRSRMIVAVKSSALKDPTKLVATLAHELGHAILIGGGLIDPKEEGMEPLTDLLTVFLGLGIFTSNAAGQFKQFDDGHRQGWSTSSTGYLTEEAYGYALAVYANRRNEKKPDWEKYLSTNVKHYFKRSQAFLICELE
jgi:hypothetical protein